MSQLSKKTLHEIFFYIIEEIQELIEKRDAQHAPLHFEKT